MADQEGAQEPDESLELSFLEWFKVRVPAIIILALFGDAARSKRKLRALSERGTQKAALGEVLTEDEQLVHDLDMAQARKEHVRLLQTGARAAEIIAKEPKLLPGHVEGERPPEPQVPNEGWSDRYKEGAKLHADPDVREMWARILAGQVTTPGSFSFKTLTVLKDVDTNSARKFSQLLAFTLNGQGLPAAAEFLANYHRIGVTYADLLLLNELGLIVFPTVSSISEEAPPTQLACRGGYTLVLHERGKLVNIQALTLAGRELATITDVKVDRATLDSLVEWLAPKCARLQIGLPIDAESIMVRDWSPDVVVVDDATGAASFKR